MQCLNSPAISAYDTNILSFQFLISSDGKEFMDGVVFKVVENFVCSIEISSGGLVRFSQTKKLDVDGGESFDFYKYETFISTGKSSS